MPLDRDPPVTEIMTTTCDRLHTTTALLRDAAMNLATADHAVHHAEQEAAAALHLADRDLDIALAGLGLRRWRGLMNGTATIATPADGCDLVLAHHHAEEIQTAIARRAAVGMWHSARVSATKDQRREARLALRQIVGPDLFI